MKIPAVWDHFFSLSYSYYKDNMDFTSYLKSQRDVFERTNNIFYAVGLFFSALEKAEAQDISLREALYQIQFIKDPFNSKMVFNTEVSSHLQYYTFGLEKLRECNPRLSFLSSAQYLHLEMMNREKQSIVEATIQNWIYQENQKSATSKASNDLTPTNSPIIN